MVPQEYMDFLVMREMGWDWWTFQNQPAEWVELVELFIRAEAQVKPNGDK